MNHGDEITLKISDITSAGWGLGRYSPDGDSSSIVVFVPGAAPGETVAARILQQKKNYLRAELLEVLEPHPSRRLPPCPFFSSCPGCSLQFLAYDAQLDARVRRVSEIISRASGNPSLEMIPVPSPVEFGYRTHVSVKFEQKNGKFAVGFTDPATRRVVDIPECLLIPEWAWQDYSTLRERLGAHASALPHSFSIRLFFDHDEKTTYAVPTRGPFKKNRRLPQVIKSVLKGFQPVRALQKEIADVKIKIHPASFVQANHFLTDTLYLSALELVQPPPGATVLDLYSGSGWFTLALAPEVMEIIAVESDTMACDNLEKSSKDLTSRLVKSGRHEPSIHIYQGRAEDLVPDIIPRHNPSLVIANPPRSGINPVIIESICNSKSINRFVMVSCDPATCARDMKKLQSGGFVSEKAVLLDCYPQTAHMEIIVALSR